LSRRLKTISITAALFAANLWVAKELLTSAFIDQMGSIEGTHIALGRFILKHWPDLFWFPLWYGGVPYQNAYLPLHPFAVAATTGLFGMSPGHAYHALTAVFYALGPVTLFLLALKLSGSRAYSLGASLIYSFSSPAALLIPAVARDVGSVWHARRLQDLVQYGEGPHIAAMTLLPVAVLLLVVAFKRRRPVWWILAAAGLAFVALTNWLGALALALAAAAWLLSGGGGVGLRKWFIAIGLGLYAYVISCSWLPPSTIQATFTNETRASGPPAALARWMAIGVGLLLMAVLVWLLRRFKAPPALAFSVLFLFSMAWLTLSEEWARVSILHQAGRLHLEMEMGIALAAAFGAKLILDAASARVRTAVACVLLILAGYAAVRYRAYAMRLDRPIDIRQTIEYREAQWISANLDGHRVLAPGSVGFFLNVFSDTPQFGGGYYQSLVNPVYLHLDFQIFSGQNAGAEEGPIAVLLLKALGVDAVGVSGPRSREAFKPFSNPRKFEGILPELWRDGDDVIYQVPRRSPSLAHVVRLEDLPARQPENGLDLDPIRPYVRALDDPSLPLAHMTWRNQHTAVISAGLERDQILSVQINYHPGWTATVNGQPRRVFRDNLGQLAVAPECQGPCSVEIAFDGGTEMLLARILCWSGLLGGLVWAVWRRRTP
jgi:hypothetical protein